MSLDDLPITYHDDKKEKRQSVTACIRFVDSGSDGHLDFDCKGYGRTEEEARVNLLMEMTPFLEFLLRPVIEAGTRVMIEEFLDSVGGEKHQ